MSQVLENKYIWHKTWGNYKQGLLQPYLMAYQMPKSHWGKVMVMVMVFPEYLTIFQNISRDKNHLVLVVFPLLAPRTLA